MADSWEDEADGLDAVASTLPGVAMPLTDKWEGEDDDDVPDAWDAEPEPKPAEEKPKPSGSDAAKPKKRSKQVAAAAEKKEAEGRRQQPEAPAGTGGDSKEAVEEKLSKEQLRRKQEEADFLVALDTFGISDAGSKEEFDKLGDLIAKKLRQYETSPHYPLFIESLFRNCTLELDCDTLRKLSTMFSAVANEKQKLLKAVSGKGKKKGKATVRVERDAASGALEDDGGYDEFDDFI